MLTDDLVHRADTDQATRPREFPRLVPAAPSPRRHAGTPAADAIAPLLSVLFPDGVPVPFRFWDGSVLGPDTGPGTVLVRSPNALRRLLWAPGDLGVARAFVIGDLDVEGDLFAVLRALHTGHPDFAAGPAELWSAVQSCRRAGALGPPLPPPPEEARTHGWRHSKRRDSQAIRHHYDVGNHFYRLFLGPSMTYSSARFVDDRASLEEAQAAKHELVCRKLGLPQQPGARLLDVGCGWGSMALHAAAHHGAQVVGITISASQVELARARVAAAGLTDRIEIRLQDYRDLRGEQFDAISSIGMFEHVGAERTAQYFDTLHSLLRPGGRLLNHAISSMGGSRLKRRSFMGRFVFPDGELLDVGNVVLAMENRGFEVRDVESLREHYVRTLRAWVANLEAGWEDAVALVGPGRARVWRLYMAASALGFEDNGVAVHQVLGVVPDADGHSAMPPVRTW
ncbi:MAG TPA: cyclopropane-fatty-acyl-phospholipid synthase family protein [Acidimicrobiales bacterium]|jgi:cyclopropane-fatty-acyl-phospholipid synthase|nr:cyclopropane-fatty-acyl-phospholipid synthase family protein [Acidimicrobiales bacterium]